MEATTIGVDFVVRSTDSVFILIKRTLAHKGTDTNRWVPFVLLKIILNVQRVAVSHQIRMS